MNFLIPALTVSLLMEFAGPPAPKGNGVVLVKIEYVRSALGQIRASLFNSADGFPGDHTKAAQVASVPITNVDSVMLEFKGVEYGEYAVALFHDEDNDGQLKMSEDGMPLEGFAISNDPDVSEVPPTFENSKFTVQSDTVVITVHMSY